MREIKFRVYHEDYGLLCGKSLFEIIVMAQQSEELEGVPDAHFMQFTGLKDADGAEIYEGDIVKVESYGQLLIYEVVGPTDDYPAFDLKGWRYDSNGLSHCMCAEWHSLKVIGNIYENKELLD